MTLPLFGRDVSKKKFPVVVVGTAGRTLQHEFSNRACGFAQLANFLHQAGHRVSVVNPRQIRAFAESTSQAPARGPQNDV